MNVPSNMFGNVSDAVGTFKLRIKSRSAIDDVIGPVGSEVHQIASFKPTMLIGNFASEIT